MNEVIPGQRGESQSSPKLFTVGLRPLSNGYPSTRPGWAIQSFWDLGGALEGFSSVSA